MVWINNGTPELDTISQYRTIIGVCLALTIATITIVALRAFVRARILRILGPDDFVIFFTAICAIIYNGICIGQSKWGLGLPLARRPKVDLDQYSVINFTGRPFYMMGVLGFKVALCIAYLRIMRTTSFPRYKATVWTVMLWCIISHLIGTLILIFQCSPVRKSWLPRTPGTCLPNGATFYGLAAITIIFDVVIFFLPIPLLISLNIANKKKVALICVFLLGLLTTICSCLRMSQISIISKTGNSTMLVLWGVIELNTGIILTCIPTLGPLFPCFGSSKSVSLSKSSNKTSDLPGNAATKKASVFSRKYKELTPSMELVNIDSRQTKAPDPESSACTSTSECHGTRAEPEGPTDDILRTTDIQVSIQRA